MRYYALTLAIILMLALVGCQDVDLSDTGDDDVADDLVQDVEDEVSELEEELDAIEEDLDLGDDLDLEGLETE